MSVSREGLLKNLDELRPAFDDQGVAHIAIDPTPGKQIIYTSLDEFVAGV